MIYYNSESPLQLRPRVRKGDMVLVDGLEALLILTEKEVNNNKEPRVKKMGPNSELHSSSLKIRRKRFLNSIFWNLRVLHNANLSLLIQMARTVYSTNFISSWAKESILLATEEYTSYNSNVMIVEDVQS
ncbi:hypothetical protein DVH24_025836 [Malus domestica]|uniref:Uncharacterized protein n=1 Tax=Malus domestica TaxID=3750 RepID=A0A498KEA7_MALDO|nr:hypothetical protein DVH24_025836 [Malus domestica]